MYFCVEKRNSIFQSFAIKCYRWVFFIQIFEELTKFVLSFFPDQKYITDVFEMYLMIFPPLTDIRIFAQNGYVMYSLFKANLLKIVYKKPTNID